MNDQNPLETERQRLQARYDEQPDSRVFAPLADCLRKLGRLQEALGVCHTGLSKHPRYSSAFVILGKIHLERGDDEAAREAFERVLDFDPQNLLALRQLAELDETRDDWPAAVDRWEQVTALEIDPVKAEERLEAARARLEGAAGPEWAQEPDSADEEADDVEDEVTDGPDAVAEPAAGVDEIAEATEDDVAAVPEDDASRETTDHTLIGETEDRTDEVREPAPEPTASYEAEEADEADEAPEFAPGPPVPDESALAPYRTTAPDVDEDPIAAELDEEIENEADDEAASGTPEPAPSAAASVAADDTIPTTEIATMTLAEIYAEQGFREKALVILRQVLERNPDAEKVARRIEELEAVAPAAEPTPEPAAEPPVEERASQPPVDEDVRDAIDPEPITLRAEDTRIEPDDGGEAPEPEVEPAPPLTARTSPEAEEEDERERYGHFKNWLDRIRVDD